VNGTEDRPVVVRDPPPVCPLCWGWVLEGESTVQMEAGKAHRECWRRCENNC
jgi:hypothetical protein